MSGSNDASDGFQKRARPVSTMALDFSEQLDGLFNLGGEIPTLMNGIEDRKVSVNNSSRELEELEARIKAMEERLQRAAHGGEDSAAAPADAAKTIPSDQAPSSLAAPRSAVSSRPSSSSRPQAPSSAPPPPPPGRAPPVPGSAPPSRAPPGRPNPANRTGYDGRMMSDASSMRDHGEYGVAH